MSKLTEDQIIAFMARKLSDLEARDMGRNFDDYWYLYSDTYLKDCTALWYELRDMVDIKETKDETP